MGHYLMLSLSPGTKGLFTSGDSLEFKTEITQTSQKRNLLRHKYVISKTY